MVYCSLYFIFKAYALCYVELIPQSGEHYSPLHIINGKTLAMNFVRTRRIKQYTRLIS